MAPTTRKTQPEPRRRHRRRAIVLACTAAVTCPVTTLHAQTDGSDTNLPRVTVTAPAAAASPAIAGFGDRAIEALPLQATVIDREQIEAAGARRLADLIKFDASTTDAYNSPGYWDYLTVRGYVIDQRFNYRREGLPISAETAIPLENKDRVEILKGISGIQSGTSAPGGLVNYLVKRPAVAPIRSATLTTGERGSVGLALDLGDRLGEDRRFGYRITASHEDRRPEIDDYGHLRRSVLALAGDWRLGNDSLIEAEIEWSRQTGASLPGYSLTGDVLPATRRPANLNNQPWSLPNEFEGLTGSLRYDQQIGGGWRWVSQVGSQRLRSDDRLAFPYGCSDDRGTADTSDDVYYADRYCPNGNFDLYDFRSDNERRRVDAGQTFLQGQVQTGPLRHDLRAGVLLSRLRYDFKPQVNQYVGQGNIDGSLVVNPNPEPNDAATDRSERSREFFVNDAIDWGQGWITWLGLRHTRLQRDSVRTDGTRPTGYGQSLTTPWLAVSYEWQPRRTVYASWGQGAESAVVPGRPDQYPNAGEALPALKSRQWELGLKGSSEAVRWSLAYFDIDRPAITDTGTAFFRDGRDHHRGVEATAAYESGPWLLRGGAMRLDAQREDASDPNLNGQRPINVPKQTLKLQSRYRVAAVHGLDLNADLVHEGRRSVLADGSIELPSWTRTDVGMRYAQNVAGVALTWRFGIDNLFDRRTWKESPFQFGHVYLFPLEARTWRLSLQAAL